MDSALTYQNGQKYSIPQLAPYDKERKVVSSRANFRNLPGCHFQKSTTPLVANPHNIPTNPQTVNATVDEIAATFY